MGAVLNGRRRGSRGEHGQVVSSSVAVGSVIAVILASVAFFAGVGDDSSTTDTEAKPANATPSAPPSVAAPPEPMPTPETRRHGGRRDKETRRDRRSPDQRDGTDREKKQQRAQQEPAVPDVYVEVYNNTGVSGLASSQAALLQDSGWQVVGVDNWYGDIPASTVYYPDGLYDEAQQLATELGVGRTHEAVAPMRFDRLTVILTSDLA